MKATPRLTTVSAPTTLRDSAPQDIVAADEMWAAVQRALIITALEGAWPRSLTRAALFRAVDRGITTFRETLEQQQALRKAR